MEYLFSYGTLQTAAVQLKTFGRLLQGQSDVLEGFLLEMIAIRDADVVATSGATHHPIITSTGNSSDTVAGVVLEVTLAELEGADAYEVDDYRRVVVELQSGIKAWVYMAAESESD